MQQVLASAAASLAPLAQPVRGPAQGPAGFMPFMPYPLPADPPVQQPQSFQQASDNVVQDGPLRGDQLVDDLTPTDPSQIRPPLDPAYLVRVPACACHASLSIIVAHKSMPQSATELSMVDCIAAHRWKPCPASRSTSSSSWDRAWCLFCSAAGSKPARSQSPGQHAFFRPRV